MKIIYATITLTCLTLSITFAQNKQPNIRYENGFGVMGPFEAVIVPPLKPIDDSQIDPAWAEYERKDGRHEEGSAASDPIEPPTGFDGALQEDYNYNRTPVFNEVFNVTGFGYNGSFPPDPSSACGDLHFVVAINGGTGCQYRVYNKTTGAQIGSTVGFESTINLPGGSYGDAIVVYDDLADRWVLTEISDLGNVINVYVSQTNNITTTSWYGYQINCNGYDYPKLSVWPSAYFLTLNDGGPSVYALNRTNMLTGAATTVITRTATDLSAFWFQALAPVDFDGNNPPPANAPGILLRHRDTEGHGPGGLGSYDYLEVFEFGPNFASPGSSTWTSTPTQIQVAEFDSELSGWTDFTCFPQPGTSQLLDPIRELIMNRPQYINFGTHQSIVGCQVVDANGSNRGGIRWYEIRKPAATWTLYQNGTYAPASDALSRWMPTISQDLNGNIAICYSVSGSTGTNYPGLRMTARSSTDPLGTMTLPEYTIINGQSSQTGIERWGDYFCMTQDPVTWNTFYFAGMRMATGGQWSIRNFAFNFSSNSLDVNMFNVLNMTAPFCNQSSRNIGAVITNAGSTTLTSTTIRHSLNGAGPTTINWTGSLASGQSDTINITLTPIVNGPNTFTIWSQNPNGGTDQDFGNDTLVYNFNASFGLTGTSQQLQNILCFNQNNGQIQINATGGYGSYTYSIGGSFGASNTFNSVGPGTYTCYVQDAAGCKDTILPTLVFTNPSDITASGTATNASSGGASDGSINVTAYGGTGSLDYSINGGAAQSSNIFNGLAPGSYTITVTDDNGCTETIIVNVGALGIDVNPLENGIRIFPNPTSGKITIGYISGYTANDALAEVYDNLGQVVRSMYIGNLVTGQNIEMDLTGLSRATYTFRLSSGKWFTEKRIILQ